MTLNKYLRAENEIQLILNRYCNNSISELSKSNLIPDVEAYLKKWCREIPALKSIRNDLRQNLEDCKKEDSLQQESILNAYQICVEDLYGATFTINAERLHRQACRIISKIDEGMDSYFYNRFG